VIPYLSQEQVEAELKREDGVDIPEEGLERGLELRLGQSLSFDSESEPPFTSRLAWDSWTAS